ncbi:hypothetical protein [Lacibacter sp.]|uniref:hypothetical protein n=1 Tax=Lacibacter sp. TaxID=1915409 RepID=UPI002B4AECA1|nr:hypothetical protein [Lacibacter sp.]HLP39550.1 hypothetical protein [Lacibacter sp.]
MSVVLLDREINKIHVIDDDTDSRESYGLTVEEIEVETVLQNDRVDNIETFLLTIGNQDAVVSDHHLKKSSSYFPMNGANFISKCYDRHIPSVLVTKYEMASYHEIRPFKRNIPVVLTPEQFNPDTLVKALELCVAEFKGNLSQTRKTWKTLVRFDDVIRDDAGNKTVAMAILPSWNRNMVINLKMLELPHEIQEISEPDLRLYAQVNIDAEDPYELYFQNWEIIKK